MALDTNPVIYAFEQNAEFGPVVRPVFEQIGKGTIRAYASVVTLVEVLTRPLRLRNEPVARLYREFLLGTENVTTVALTTELAEQAADLRARYNLKTADAIVAATALQSRCEALLTNDEDLKEFKDTKVLYIGAFV